MWTKAVDRQYSLFGTILIVLITGLSIVGTIIGSTNFTLILSMKILFALISVILLFSVLALLRMAHIERNIAFRADPPKSIDTKLQNEENNLRLFVNIAIGVAIAFILLLVNAILWVRL